MRLANSYSFEFLLECRGCIGSWLLSDEMMDQIHAMIADRMSQSMLGKTIEELEGEE